MTMALPSTAQTALSRQSHDAAHFLSLSPTQHRALVGVQRRWADFEQAQTARAAATRSPEAMARICAESVARQLQGQQDAQAVLTPEQRTALARLEEALSLMPAVLSAQTSLLLARSAPAPVGGLPEGSAEAEQIYQRVQAKPLPGCQNSLRLHPGTRPTGDNPAPSRQRP